MGIDLTEMMRRLALAQPGYGGVDTSGPPPDQMASPMITGAPPPAAPPAPPPPQPSLFSRIMNGMFHVPSSMEGQLTPGDIRSAQAQGIMAMGSQLASLDPHTLGAATFIGAGQQGFQGALGNLSQAATAAQNLQELQHKNALMQTQQQGLAQASQAFPDIPGEPKEQRWARMSQAAMKLALSGNAADAGSVAALIKAEQDHASSAAGQYAPPEWHKAYDAQNPEPPANTAAHAQWLANKARAAADSQFGGTAMRYYQDSAQETRQGNFAVTSGQRNVALGQSGTRIVNAQEKEFLSQPDVKQLVDKQPKYEQALTLIAQARTMPMATGSAVINVIQALDPKAQVRSQIIDYMGNFDKSLKGTIEQKIAKISTGTYPPYILDGIQAMVEKAKLTDMQNYDRAQKQYIQSHPGASVRSTKQMYNQDLPTGKLDTSKLSY